MGQGASRDPLALIREGEADVDVVIPEHSRSTPIRLSSQARVALFSVTEDRLHVLATADPDVVVLESTSWVGSVSVPGLVVRVTPNAPMSSIFAMLGGLDDQIAWGRGTTRYAGHDELLDGSALVILRSIDAATRRGLLHGYRTREEESATIRGRLLVDQLARRPWALAEPPCRFDEFTVDVAENQLLRCAVELILAGRGLSPSTRHQARDLLARFEGVSSTPPSAHQGALPITRLNEHYAPALDLARLALDGFSVRQEDGPHAAHAFLVDIDQIFLRFVATSLRERLWPRHRVEQAESLPLDDSASLRATADVLIHDAAGPSLVVGTRYHLMIEGAATSPVAMANGAGAVGPLAHLHTAAPSRSAMTGVANDAAAFFPVMIQAASLGLPAALVVYAHSARRPASRIRMPSTATTVHSWHVDLTKDWESLREDLDDLAEHARAIMSSRR